MQRTNSAPSSKRLARTDLTELLEDVARTYDFDAPRAVIAAADALRVRGDLDLPLAGGGHTAARFEALAEIAATDLSLARIAEGHVDAIAILGEAGSIARRGLYGVWAADDPRSPVTAVRAEGGWRLSGRRRYASGARGLDRALVTAHAEDGLRLFDIAVRSERVRPIDGSWNAVGMAATESVDVEFDEFLIPPNDAVGVPDFYLERPGFRYGGMGVAACWYGGALGCLRMLRRMFGDKTPNEHQKAHLGAITAACEGMKTSLRCAAWTIDQQRGDSSKNRDLDYLVLVVRQLVESGCQEVLIRTGRAGGTGPLVFDRAQARRSADLAVYLRQHHAERDLAALGTLSLERQS